MNEMAMMYMVLNMGKKQQIQLGKLIAYDMAYLMKWTLVMNTLISLSFVEFYSMSHILPNI